SSSARRSRTAACASRTRPLRRSGGWRRSARRSGSRSSGGERAEGVVALGRQERALAAVSGHARGRARDRGAAGELLPAAAGGTGDRNLVEAVEEAVAAAARAAVPALGRRDRRPAAVARR